MNRRSRTLHRPAKSPPETFHKYLKPGALAQIRNNSRIIARFNRVNPLSLIHSTRSSSISSPIAPMNSGGLVQVNIVDDSPCFAGRLYGPLCLQRKKLLAAKSCFIGSTPTNLTTDSPPDPVIEVLSG